MSQPAVAILGLGIMGSGMARRLLSGGFPLSVYNRNRDKANALAGAGARLATTPAEAVSCADIVISIVGDDAASRAVWLGADGALPAARPGALLIESSTLTVAWVVELGRLAAEHQQQFLDAPVTGTKPHAASGQLLFLVGGSRAALERARPVFSVLGRDAIHLGPVGSGTRMKLINNFLCGVQVASFAEALALIDAGGLDRQKAMSILTEGAPGSGIFKRIAARATSGDYTPDFLLRWMAKDLGYASVEAAQHGLALETAASALSVFNHAIEQGHGEEDFSAVIKLAKATSL